MTTSNTSQYNAVTSRYDKMVFKFSGNSGLKLPIVSLGLWHNFGGIDSIETGREMLRKAFDLGITHFDLAIIMDHHRVQPKQPSGKFFAKIFFPIGMNW